MLLRLLLLPAVVALRSGAEVKLVLPARARRTVPRKVFVRLGGREDDGKPPRRAWPSAWRRVKEEGVSGVRVLVTNDRDRWRVWVDVIGESGGETWGSDLLEPSRRREGW